MNAALEATRIIVKLLTVAVLILGIALWIVAAVAVFAGMAAVEIGRYVGRSLHLIAPEETRP